MYAPTGDQNGWDRGGGSRHSRVYEYKKEPVVSSITSILGETNSQEGGIGLYTHSLQFITPTPRQTLWSPEVSPLPTEVPWNSLFAGSSRESSRNPQYTPLPTGSPLEILLTPFSALKLPPPPKPHHVDHVQRAQRVLGTGKATANHLPSFGDPNGPKDLGGGSWGPSSWTPTASVSLNRVQPNPILCACTVPPLPLDWRNPGLIQDVDGPNANQSALRH